MKDFRVSMDDYRNADETSRLYLFLEHPQLRQAFMEIELKSPNTDATQAKLQNNCKITKKACLSLGIAGLFILAGLCFSWVL